MLEVPRKWQKFIASSLDPSLLAFLTSEYREETVYPKQENIFKALEVIEPEQVKVIIIGQDPYHGEGQANGLAFSVQQDQKLPPSLRNIYQELENDLGILPASHGDLTSWAEQGVLLLNAVMTVRKGQAHSHRHKGWEAFTDTLIERLGHSEPRKVFILWGQAAQKKETLIDLNKHAIIKSAHPSPLSAYRGFFGSAPFSKTNQYLKKWGYDEIIWQIKEH